MMMLWRLANEEKHVSSKESNSPSTINDNDTSNHKMTNGENYWINEGSCSTRITTEGNGSSAADQVTIIVGIVKRVKFGLREDIVVEGSWLKMLSEEQIFYIMMMMPLKFLLLQ